MYEDLYQLVDPIKPFKTILIDPPWPSSKRKDQAGWLSRNTKPRYDTMSATDLMSLPVGTLAADDAMLVLWATWMHLPLAIDLIKMWGFQYATGMPWLKVVQMSDREYDHFNGVGDAFFGWSNRAIPKPIYGPGVWFQHCTELVLLARRGRPFGAGGNPRPARKGIIIAPRQEHSRKPDELHRWIEAKFPGPMLEMFARRPRKGWTVWGNEV